MNSWLDFGPTDPPSHGENRGSSPLGSASSFNKLAAIKFVESAASPTFLQWTVLQEAPKTISEKAGFVAIMKLVFVRVFPHGP